MLGNLPDELSALPSVLSLVEFLSAQSATEKHRIVPVKKKVSLSLRKSFLSPQNFSPGSVAVHFFLCHTIKLHQKKGEGGFLR